jgi:hypothetical protein
MTGLTTTTGAPVVEQWGQHGVKEQDCSHDGKRYDRARSSGSDEGTKHDTHDHERSQHDVRLPLPLSLLGRQRMQPFAERCGAPHRPEQDPGCAKDHDESEQERDSFHVLSLVRRLRRAGMAG